MKRRGIHDPLGKTPARGREAAVTGWIILAMFAALLAYFVWFEAAGRESVLVNPLNNRTSNMAQTVFKGSIVSSDDVNLAVTQNADDGTEYRYYPFPRLFCHTIGYADMGGAGLEASQKILLLTSHIPVYEQIANELFHTKSIGDTLHVTLNYQLQQYCYDLLGGRNGAIIAMEPSTGKILAMVSEPDFDASTVAEDWDSLISEENTSGNLLNRASQGLYPPGSTFKVITLLEYIRENPDTWQDFSYTCTGTYTYEGQTVECHDGHAHGTVDIYGALEQSCNGAFITIGRTLDPEKWQELAEDFGYNEDFSLDVEFNSSSFSISSGSDTWDVIQEAIGQGTTTCTPLLNLMIYSAIGNGGVMMKPYLVDCYTNAHGDVVRSSSPQVLLNCISAEEADLLTDFCTRVISNGSGYQAAADWCQVAGKTGSAQYSSESGKYHAWFVGFAPAEDPEIAVCVIIEKGGAGGEVAAPIAGQIFNRYHELKEEGVIG
ncbi:MAG: peptidoglycan D,D-transpeptidase FtsI family protein [Lachnospiraceae bacterium]